MSAPWAVTHTVHVWPIGDLIDHEQSDRCACKPTADVFATRNAALTYQYVHHSLDGRELTEP